MANGNDNGGKNMISTVWWIDLLRREGVLVALVVGYAWFIAIPESQMKQKALAATQQMADSLADTVVKIQADQHAQAAAIERIDRLQAKVTDEHLQMLDAQKKALMNHEKILESETAIVKNQGVIIGMIEPKAARANVMPKPVSKPNL